MVPAGLLLRQLWPLSANVWSNCTEACATEMIFQVFLAISVMMAGEVPASLSFLSAQDANRKEEAAYMRSSRGPPAGARVVLRAPRLLRWKRR